MMKNRLFVKPILFTLLILGSQTHIFAQDSAVKAKVIKPVVKTPVGTTVKPRALVNKPYVAKPYVIKPGAATYRTPGSVQLPAKPAVTPGQPPVYAETPISTDKSLGGQYQYVLSKTYHYQQPMIAALWKNINDTLALTRKNLKEARAKLAAQTQSISTLQNDAKTKDQTLSDATTKRDEISLLGIPMAKTAYNLLMWGLVIGMALVLTIVILKTAGAGREAKYRIKLFEEVSEEFAAYKAKANDKEKKLARELQTERNKVDELMGRG